MHLDAALHYERLTLVPDLACAAEAMGFDGISPYETLHDPFPPLAFAAEHTWQIHMGTGVAISCARGPTVIAYTARNLAAMAPGQILLRLGTQAQAHIERRFGMPWDLPVPELCETAEAIRAAWACRQNGERLKCRSRLFKLTRMSPFFDPVPIPDPRVPILLAGENPPLARLASEIGDGLFVYPFHTPCYPGEVLILAIEANARKASQQPEEILRVGSVFSVTGRDEAEMPQARELVRAQVALYGSAPSCGWVWALHSWEALGEQLSDLAARGHWEEMSLQVPDEILEAFSLTAPPEAVWGRLQAAYEGLPDQVILC
ncbi:MAG: LLM class flavin-dependent oxidoreductase [Thermoflexus sp.]|jgi:probable F420-dependent oxidoreductase|nr:LLM class flavin-dependent oxidoreductase [Thermoflexus sp.]